MAKRTILVSRNVVDRAVTQGPTLRARLGDMLPQLRDMEVEVPIQVGVEALKVVIGEWKKHIRQAIARSIETARGEVAVQEDVVKAVGISARRKYLEAESRLNQLRELAHDLEDRRDWVWKDEVFDLLGEGEKAFIGMERGTDGVWREGFWRYDREVMPEVSRQIAVSAKGEKVPPHLDPAALSRRWVNFELIDRLAARKMYQLESALEGKNRKLQKVVVEAFVGQWTRGDDNPYDVEEED